MTPEILASALAVLLSLFFSYIPGANTWFAAKSKEAKQGLMLLMLLVIAGASFGLSCAGWLEGLTGLQISCTQAGFIGLLRTFVLAIIANQGVYALSPNTAGVREIKASR